MQVLNHEYREIGIVLSNEWIFQCPKCKAFAIGITKPFVKNDLEIVVNVSCPTLHVSNTRHLFRCSALAFL